MKIDKKIAVLVGDGMADFPIKELGDLTPLEYAKTPNMDKMAKEGILGLAKTVPAGMAPGSDTANLSLFGYDPKRYFTGRSPLEALNMGIELGEKDVSFRLNFVNISDENIMTDFSAGHIETGFSDLIIEELKKNVKTDGIELYTGVSYRNILIWRNYPYDTLAETTPPHDIQGKETNNFLPSGSGADLLNEITNISKKVIKDSQIIKSKRSRFKGDPTSIWLWGGGRKPVMDSMKDRYGLSGHTISAVDLIHGIGKAIGLSPIHVEGVTGYLDTNYEGKSRALLDAMKKSNFIFLHVESPDESGHEGNKDHKIKAIEDFDSKVVGRVLKGMESYDDYLILVTPDHPTPISLKTHTADPVPFSIYGSKKMKINDSSSKNVTGFNEKSAKNTDLYIEEGHRLIELMLKGSLIY